MEDVGTWALTDILLDELPTDDIAERRIVFVYEEFMEYAAAKVMYQQGVAGLSEEISGHVKKLQKSLSNGFVNSLGIANYLCAFYLDHNLYRSTFSLISELIASDERWAEAVVGVFDRYENSFCMVLDLAVSAEERDSKRLARLLETLGESSRSMVTDLCVLIGFRVLFPYAIPLSSYIKEDENIDLIQEQEAFIDVDVAGGRKLIKIISKIIVDLNINPVRCCITGNFFWKSINNTIDCKVYSCPIKNYVII